MRKTYGRKQFDLYRKSYPPAMRSRSVRRGASSGRPLWMNGLVALFALVVVTGAVRIFHRSDDAGAAIVKSADAATSEAKSDSSTVLANSAKDSDSPSDLENQLAKITERYPDFDYGVSVINLNTGQRAELNGDVVFRAASTTKMLTAVAFLKKVEQGSETLQEKLGGKAAQYQLQQMINQSNNDSWDLFNAKIGFDYQQDYARSLGLSSYKWDGNLITPHDMAALLAKFYSGELLKQSNVQLLTSYMHDTNEEDYIPPAVPKGYSLYHKTGTLEDDMHDVAIVDGNGKKYVIAIYSNGRGFLDYDKRVGAFRDIVKAVLAQ